MEEVLKYVRDLGVPVAILAVVLGMVWRAWECDRREKKELYERLLEAHRGGDEHGQSRAVTDSQLAALAEKFQELKTVMLTVKEPRNQGTKEPSKKGQEEA